MEFTLNGQDRTFDGDPGQELLAYLRDVAGLKSPKDGCSGEGICGCCTVLVDGKARLSCRMAVKDVAGRTVTTVEGLSPEERDAFADAFVLKGGVQCGFCTPGIVMKAASLLRKNPGPTREEIRDGLNGNLCRCTGYKKVIDSVACAAEALREGRPVAFPGGTGAVGTRHPKYTAREAVLGERVFVGDMVEPGMVYGALRFSDHPRARVLRVDTTEALQVEGVLAVLTARDIKGRRVNGMIYRDWPVMVLEGEETRCIGDVLASVAASTEEAARAAAGLVRVEYEVLPPVTDIFEALEPGAPQLTDHGNVLSVTEVRLGDAEGALRTAAHVTRQRYTTQRIEHAFLEPEAALAVPWTKDGEAGVKIFDGGQGGYEDRRQIAELLDLPERLVNVVLVQNGGAFGGKEDLMGQHHAAMLCLATGRPVMLRFDRKTSLRTHAKRHPIVMDYELGCDAEGRLVALVARMHSDSGAYASVGMKVIERAVAHSAGAYAIPNVHVKGTAVITNNAPCGAMRGFGANQAAFGIESSVDELCALGGFDRWQFRWDNALTEGKATATGQVLRSGVGVRACLEALEGRFRAAKYAGLAAGIKNTGIGCGMPDSGMAKIEILGPQKVVLHHGWCEMGQGAHNMALQTLVTETGIDPAVIEVRVETDAETRCGMTTASRGTSLVGNSVREAARGLKADLAAGLTLADLAGRTYRGEWVCDWTTKVGQEPPEGREIVTHYSYGYAAQLVELDGAGRITRVTAAHDAGRIMNPTLFEGQIEGSLHMGLGYAITEDFPYRDGWPVSWKMADLGILRTRDMPELDVIGVEVPDAHGPYGAKGVGEIGLVPTAPAVANALRQFDGVRRTALPLRELRLLGRGK
ncbi:selenium-dependent xanthine dehydrogenase [Mesoterricola silvestris]|uniref:Selenium-dependent xanthine dehydrogenase n=1 Tax=Mesoterricola silvestris TaxID=2927979 RepID=A0AA48GN63_9BACT|nr:selenium-dependent xanthine dehydrogenase [Mesoterricola silvestris]BDU72959.1 selenium-dependent xanthine dehydrogenase [Mesoterricola silvestris]